MKTLLIVISFIIVFFLFGFYILAQQSKSPPELGLLNGKLRPCLHASNCINTLDASNIESFEYKSKPNQTLSSLLPALLPRVIKSVEIMGGTVEQQVDNYLWATFRSPLFGFVDDVEFLIDLESQQIHIRSASRVGRSDFSANRKRIEALRQAFMATEN